jgi:hypothetical protein
MHYDVEKVTNRYSEFVKKGTLVPNLVFYVLGIISLLLAPEVSRYLYGIAAYCLLVLARREGHKGGYIEGHSDGWHECLDMSSGISPELREKFDEMDKP